MLAHAPLTRNTQLTDVWLRFKIYWGASTSNISLHGYVTHNLLVRSPNEHVIHLFSGEGRVEVVYIEVLIKVWLGQHE